MLVSSTTFAPADPARTYMDRGGVWNGSAEVTATTGDTLQLTACNTATGAGNTAFDMTSSVTLPSGFAYVPGTAAGIAGITASQGGTALTFTIPANTDITTGTCRTIGFGVSVATQITAGTYPMNWYIRYGTTDGATDGGLGTLQNVLVESGGATILKTPNTQLKAVGATANWTLTVTNTGGGGLFSVLLNEAAINPGVSLAYSTMTQTGPALPAASTGTARLTLPYLSPGQQFTATVAATVTGCQDITNTAYLDDRTHVSSTSVPASVALDFKTPLIAFTAPAITLNNLTTTHLTVAITNTGLGAANATVLATTLASFPIVVSSVTAGWSYDAVSGSFTKTANGGTIANGASENLDFEVAPAGAGLCTPPAGGLYFITGQYTDVCGNPYVNPVSFNSVSASYSQPGLTLSFAIPGNIVAPNAAASSTVTISIARPDLLATNPIVVVDTLPVNASSFVIGTLGGGQTATCPGGTCDPGEAITWTIPNPGGAGTVNYSMPVTFAVPVITCSDNQFAVFTATTAGVSGLGCPASDAASGSAVLTNTASTITNSGYSQGFTIAGGAHETGFSDDGDAVREPGEGEFILLTATYTFPATFIGTWAGSTYTDNFSGVSTMTYVPGTLDAAWDGGAPVAVPSASLLQTSGQLRFTAGFLAGGAFVNSPTVAGHSVTFTYKVTATDDAILTGNTRALSHFSDFEVAGGTGACTGAAATRIIQYATSVIARAAETQSLALPSVVDICQAFTATATLTGTNFATFKTSATVLTSSSYTYSTPQTPTYGGLFNGGNITYAENGGVNPTFLYTGGAFPGTGTIGVVVRRRAAASTNNSSLSATGAYDDWQTDPTAARDFATGSSAAPLLTRAGRLTLTTTPQTVNVTGNQVSWVIYANNAGSGGLYNTDIRNVIPPGLTINVSSTNAQNPNYPVNVVGIVGATATWNVTTGALPIDIAAGGGVALTVVADVAGGICSIPTGGSIITGRWGCDGTNHELLTKLDPGFTFPTGGIQATHDSVNTFAKMCALDFDTIILRNTGLVHVYDAHLSEVLEPGVTGIDLVPGTVEVSTNAGATWTALGAGGDPLGTGTAADPYVWRSTEVSQLADVSPLGEPGGYSSVRLRFQVSSNELTNGLAPQVTTKATAATACGQALSDPGTPFSLGVKKPSIAVTKTGRNLTAGQVGYTSSVYGGVGDSVEWKVVVTNAGAQQAEHLRLTDILPSDGGAATVSGPGITGTPALATNVPVRVSTLAASGANATYLVTETLGSTCVSDVNTANLSWGCTEKAEGLRSNLNSPSASTATAQLFMGPNFANASSQITFTTLRGGRSEIGVKFFNGGGTAQGMVVISTLPAGFLFDGSSTPTFTTDGAVSAMTMTAAGASPHFQLTGVLRNSQFVQVNYRVIQTGSFDVNTSSFTNPETTGAGSDPALPAGGAVAGEIDFATTCGVASTQAVTAAFDPKTPDVDMTVTPAFKTLADGASQTFDFTLKNNGDAGSFADHVAWRLASVGTGWTVTSVNVQTPGTGGTGGACVANACTEVQIGTIAAAASAVIRVVAIANDNGNPLNLVAEVEGSLYDDGGSDTGSNYSLDQSAPKIVGVTVTKSLISTSESFTSTGTLAIGEEATFRLRARWFGGADISTITLRDTLPTGLGFVAFSTATGLHDLPIPTATGNTPVLSGVVNFTAADFSGNGTFVVDLVARALNNAFNVNGRVNTNNLGVRFDAIGQTYASNDATDAFAGGTEAALHSSTATVIARPALAFDKQVKNITLGGAYGQAGVGRGGDTLEYRVTVTNTGPAPAFDLVMHDVLATNKLLMTDGSGDGIDNDGDSVVDDATEGGYTAGANGTVTFTGANTGLPLGQGLDRLDAGQTVTLTYRALVGVNASPNDSLLNGATIFATTLPGDSGSQTAPLGTPSSASGELVLTATDSSAVSITTISFNKTLVTTSQNADASTNVVVGEQVRYQLSLVLPAGTITNLRVFDHLPSGMRLLATPAPSQGTAVSAAAPTITPGGLPVDGPDITWSFGLVTVTSNTTNAERTLTILYDAQVRNIAGNVNATTLINSSSYSYTGSTPVNGSTVTIAVREPSGIVSFAMSPAAAFDAGRILTATITVSNAGGSSPAYDLNVGAYLPAGLSYVPGTTVGLSGPAIGEPDVAASSLTWGRRQAAPQDLDVTTTTPLQFRVQLLVTDAVLPSQLLGVTAVGDWTSLNGSPGPDLGVAVGPPGASDGERNGAGAAPNLYTSQASATSTVSNVYSVAKSSSGALLADGSFRVGDIVTYTLQASLQEGTVNNFRVEDVLPSGLAFDSFDPVVPASGAVAFAYAAPALSSAPTAGATGTMTWFLGRVTNAGDNDLNNNVLTLVYRARVLDAGGIATAPTVTTKVNAARLRYDDVAAAAQVSAVGSSTVTLKQPALILGKTLRTGQSVNVQAGSTVLYRVTATNAGGGPAYNVRAVDVLPVGMRATTPVVSSATLNGVGVTLGQSYTPATGVLQWDLTDGQILNGSVSGSTMALVVDYDVQVDSAAGGGLSLSNSASVTQYFSKESASPVERRTYAATASSAATVNTPLPTTISKSVDVSTSNIGGTVVYTIKIPSTTVGVALYDLRIQDALPAGLTLAALGHNGALLAPGTCGAVNVTNNTVGNAVDLTYGCLPPFTQAVITATATVRDVAGNQEGSVISNGASYTWAKTSGGAAQTAVSTAGIAFGVREPILGIDKFLVSVTTADAAQGLQAGDKVRYRIKIVNGSGPLAGAAHDLTVRDVIDQNLISPTIFAAPDNPGVPVNDGTAGGSTTYRWNVPGPLSPGATYQFDAEFTLGPGVQPQQTMVNGSSVTWTSQPGAPADERTGAGGIDDYTATDPTPVSVIVGPVHIEKTVKAPGDLTYAVGEDATYRLTFSFGQGTVNGVHVIDALPAGLVYSTAAVVVSNAQKAGGGAIAIISGPAPGALGTLDFSIGSVESTGSSPTVHIDMTARARDVGGNIDGTAMTNSVTAQLTSSTGGVVSVSPMNALPIITVIEPRLAVALDAPAGATMDLGVISTFTIRAKNVGNSEAFQPTLQALLPVGAREASPATFTTAVSIAGGRTLTFSTTEYTLAYSSTTGLLSIAMISTPAYVAAGETLTAAYQTRLDNDSVNGRLLVSTAAATQYFSRNTAAGLAAETRTHVFTLASANVGIADGAAIAGGDDHGDNAVISIRAPLLNVTKSVTPTTAILPFNTVLTWTVSLANGGAIAAAGTALTDDLGALGGSAFISSATLSTVTVSGAPGGFVDASNALGGTANKGLVSVTNLTIPAASTVTLSFTVSISSAIPNGTKILNQASLTAPGFTNPFKSDSNRAADDDATETGNNPAVANDDDPTSVVINSIPGFDFDKTAADDNGGSLVAGDTVTWTMTIRNRGTERALTSVVVDAIPANTVYVPNSTTLNAASAADVGGTSPLVSGLSVRTPGEVAGALAVYTGSEQAVVTFRVRLSSGVTAGTAISNQGSLSALGEGTGTPITKLSDDPATAPTPDPTVLIAAGGAYLLSEKSVVDDSGGFVVAGDTLTYTVTVRNLGDTAATSVVVRDQISANAAYVPGNLLYDADGSSPTLAIALTDAADADRGDYNITNSSAVTIAVGTITAHSEISFSFKARVSSGAIGGTVIANQAIISASGRPDIKSDGDGNHGNGDQPVYSVVGSTGAAVIRQTKQVTDLNGGTVDPGDELEYLITTFNVGTASATNVTVTDAVPPTNTAYSTGTTTSNGVLVADAGLISALVAGRNIGTLNPGASQFLRFRVRVSSTAPAGTNIDNQSSFSANGGALTGLSDGDLDDGIESGNSPTDPNDDDPVRVQVGGTPGSAAVNGRVWQDVDHDRTYNLGDGVEANWTVEVLRGGVLVASALSGADGTYRIANLVPGTGYQIRFRNPVTGVVYGKAISTHAGVVLTDGTIRNLTLQTGENVLNQSLPLDPNGVLYDSITRQPIAGAQVFLDGPPGYVPALHLLPGQDGQVTSVTGFYQFDINFAAGAPFGIYTLRFAAPNGYLTNLPNMPSTLIAPNPSTVGCAGVNCLDVPLVPDPFLVQAQAVAPTGVQPTVYYLRFQFDNLADAAVVNNHVPLDPILDDAIFVTKTAQRPEASRGDLVLYTITARNNYASVLPNIKLHDLLPPGFKYRSGSATLNGAAAEPAQSGRQIEWTGLTFAANETKTFKLLLIVGSGVAEGAYVNSAWAINTVAARRVSNVATATVRIVPDPTFDCSDILGKVFDDKDADGYQNEGEPGLPNVKVVTARGWIIQSDQDGRFHITCADAPNEERGSNFILKVDEQTLPTGYRITTENPRVIRLTAGKFARAEFGASLYRVARLDLSSAAFQPSAAPVYGPVWALVVDTQTIPPIRFDVGKSMITPEHVEQIREALERVKALPDARRVKLKIIGHTDSSPISGRLRDTYADNSALSRSRAAAMGELLREKLGLTPDMVVTDGKGESEPVASNATREGRTLNRRDEVQVVYERSFGSGDTAVSAAAPGAPSWRVGVDRLITALGRRPSVLRLGYCRAPGEKIEEVRFKLWQVSEEVRARWKAKPDRYALTIETEIDGASCAGGGR